MAEPVAAAAVGMDSGVPELEPQPVDGTLPAEAELALRPITPPTRAAASRELAGRMEAVCSAAMRGELDAVQAALKLAEAEVGYSVNVQGTSGRTALYQACLGRRPDIVKYLLELGATDNDGSAYIAICATGRGDSRAEDPAERTAAIMREHNWGPPSSARKKRGASGSTSASRTPKRGGPQQLLDDAVDALDSGDTSLLLVRTRTKTKGKGKGKNKGGGGGGDAGGAAAQGDLPIHHAVRVRATEALCKMLRQEYGLQEQLLLAQGVGGKLPLHCAVQTRNAGTVSILCGRGDRGVELGLGGDLIARQVATADTSGRLPIHYALEDSDHATMLELVASGSQDQLTTRDPSTGTTAIHHAAKASASDLVDAMISPLAHSARRAVLLHNRDEDGRLPVHCAVLAGDRKSTCALGFIDSGEPATAEVTAGRGGDGMPMSPMLATDRHGKLPLDYAFDAVGEAKADAALTLANTESDWNDALEAVVASNAEAQAALVEECAQKDAELAEKQATIEALQAEVASMKQRIQELTAVGATTGMDKAVEASAEEGVPPI